MLAPILGFTFGALCIAAFYCMMLVIRDAHDRCTSLERRVRALELDRELERGRPR